MKNIEAGLLQFLKGKNNRYKNPKGLEIGLTAGGEVWSYISLCNHRRGPFAISFNAEDDDINGFIDNYKIALVGDIDKLEYNYIWMRYLNGLAEIELTPFELEATLHARLWKRKTIIYSLDLHFYDEVYEHLTLPEDFERYIDTHKNRLFHACENRYKLNKK